MRVTASVKLFGALIIILIIIRRVSFLIDFIIFPCNLDPSSSEHVLHGNVVELGEFFVELAIGEETLLEGIDSGLLVAVWDRHLLAVEAPNIVQEWFSTMMVDSIKVA